MQYSISNLNAFIILISIGFSLFYFVNNTDEYKQLSEKENSPIQLISQLKGYFYINPVLALSLAITIFSFVGIPPLIGFFAKQMVLSAALDSGYVFLAIVAILTSVISAVYYLNIIKQVFFDKPDYKIENEINDINLDGNIIQNNVLIKKVTFKVDSIRLSSSLTNTISVLSLTILLFMFIPQE
jgi:NADH-ubiquinone oxidoreductase chain 2